VSACEEGRAWREALELLRQMTTGAVQRDVPWETGKDQWGYYHMVYIVMVNLWLISG